MYSWITHLLKLVIENLWEVLLNLVLSKVDCIYDT